MRSHAIGQGLDQRGPFDVLAVYSVTRAAGMPYPSARAWIGPAACSRSGTEMAHPLFWQNRMAGAPNTAAMLAASWKSPSDVAPSPKYARAHTGSPSSFAPMAHPTAWTIWVATGTQIGANRLAMGSNGPPCQTPRWYWRYSTTSTPRATAAASSRKDGNTKSSGSRAKALPTWAASWPSNGGYTVSSP